MASVRDLFRATRKLLNDPVCWTQGTFAEDIRGNSCMPDRREAVCWCLYGAMVRASADLKDKFLYERGSDALKMLAPNFVGWNDAQDRTHSEVLALLDRAVEKFDAI